MIFWARIFLGDFFTPNKFFLKKIKIGKIN
jgi:hypothetical protein